MKDAMIADSAKWTEMFKPKSVVHFLDLKDRSKSHPRQSTKRLIKRKKYRIILLFANAYFKRPCWCTERPRSLQFVLCFHP